MNRLVTEMLKETHAIAEQNRRHVKIHFVDEPGPRRLLRQTGTTDTTTAAGYDSTTITFYAAQFFKFLADRNATNRARSTQDSISHSLPRAMTAAATPCSRRREIPTPAIYLEQGVRSILMPGQLSEPQSRSHKVYQLLTRLSQNAPYQLVRN
ncbi:MAG: hypothetical protein WA446_03120 [Steroidobacteraceae bacterium]